METPEKLQPVRMWAPIKREKEWHEDKDRRGAQHEKPPGRRRPGPQAMDRNREPSGRDQANNPRTT